MSDYSNVVVLKVACPVCLGQGTVTGRLTLGAFVCHLCEGRTVVIPMVRAEWLRRVAAEAPSKSNPAKNGEPDAAS